MTINSVSLEGGKKYYALDEPITINTIKITMGSSQQTADGDWCVIALLLNNEKLKGLDEAYVYQPKYNYIQNNSYHMFNATTPKIAKGKSATISVNNDATYPSNKMIYQFTVNDNVVVLLDSFTNFSSLISNNIFPSNKAIPIGILVDVWDDNRDYYASKNTIAYLLPYSRKAPTITYNLNPVYTNKNTMELFGSYLKDYVTLNFNYSIAIDTLDPNTKFSEGNLTISGNTGSNQISYTRAITSSSLNSSFTINDLLEEANTLSNYKGKFQWDKTYTIKITATDNFGKTATQTLTIPTDTYNPLTFNSINGRNDIGLYVERGIMEIDESDPTGKKKIFVPAVDGTNLRYSYNASVNYIPRNTSYHNNSTITLSTPGHLTNFIINSQGSGKKEFAESNIIALRDPSKQPEKDTDYYTCSASKEDIFTLTLADDLTSISTSFTVPQAGAYFNIEKTGVAVGMRSSGTTGTKKFEVAKEYGAYFYGPVFFAQEPQYFTESVARADYYGMMSGLDIPEDEPEEKASETIALEPIIINQPSLEHSKRYHDIEIYYNSKYWNKQMVKDAIGRWITEKEYNEIVRIRTT